MKPGLASKVSVLTGAVMLLGSSPAASSAPSVISISSSGRIGSLQLDKSTRKSVVARTGRPAAVRTSRSAGSRVSYVALGYDCHDVEGRRTLGLTLRGPYCTTVFLINRRTGKLADFFSGSQRYRGPGGIRVGTPSAVAERARRASPGLRTYKPAARRGVVSVPLLASPYPRRSSASRRPRPTRTTPLT